MTRLVALLIGVAVIAFVGLRGPAAETSPTPRARPRAVIGAASSATPALTATPDATGTVEASAEPSIEPTSAPTAEPTSAATPKPTAKPLQPTPRPTVKPTHDPTPEGTPRITSRSGSFGQTLTVQGIAVRVARAAPQTGAINCVTDDPDAQGWTEIVSYELTMTWPDGGHAEEPWVAVGAKPWNALTFDGPSPFRSGADYIVSTCHRPSDSDKVKVEISPPGSPIIYYRWYFG